MMGEIQHNEMFRAKQGFYCLFSAKFSENEEQQKGEKQKGQAWQKKEPLWGLPRGLAPIKRSQVLCMKNNGKDAWRTSQKSAEVPHPSQSQMQKYKSTFQDRVSWKESSSVLHAQQGPMIPPHTQTHIHFTYSAGKMLCACKSHRVSRFKYSLHWQQTWALSIWFWFSWPAECKNYRVMVASTSFPRRV